MSSLALLAALALATSDTGNENCTYGGLKLDLGAMPNTKGKTNHVADDFTGLVVCTDPDTKKVYETYELVKGARTGVTKQFDRRTGRVSELVPYEGGKRNGCVKRFDDRSGHLVFEFCVRDDVPQGLQKNFDSETGVLTRITWVNPRGTQGPTTNIQFNKKGQPTSLSCGPQRLLGDDDLWCGRGGHPGEVTLYAEEGWPREKVSYLDGKQHGWTRRYHKDGRLLSEERYEHGKSVEERSVDAQGAAKFERTVEGTQEKETVFFEESKKPRLVIERKEGALVKELAYFANGKPEYEKVRRADGNYDVRSYEDTGALSVEGVFTPRWGDRLGLWSLAPTGLVKRYLKGQLRAEERYDAQGNADGLQSYFEVERPKQLQRREKWEKGRLRWSEDTAPSGDVLHRTYAEDGSVSSEVLMKPSKEI